MPHAAIFSMKAPSGYKELLSKKTAVKQKALTVEGVREEDFDILQKLVSNQTGTKLLRNIGNPEDVKTLWKDAPGYLESGSFSRNYLYVIVLFVQRASGSLTIKSAKAYAAFNEEDPFTD